LDPTETQALIDSDEAVEALRFLTDLALVYGVVPPGYTNISGGEISTLFAEGKIAMYYDGPWAPGSILSHNPDMAGKLGAAAPLARKYRMSPSIFVANGITRDCENPDAAWRFIQYLSNVESNIVYAQASGFQSMRKDVPAESTTDDPLIMQFADYLVKYGQMIEQVPHKSDIDIIVATALQEILLEVKSVEQATADAAQQIEALLAN
jgi:ABC-type glycerol-3-phosphate transport system substrate-binding protein